MEQLVHTQPHKIGERSYFFEVYKGMTTRLGEHHFNGKSYEGVVEIKAFRILIKEIVANGSMQKITVHDCGFCTSRTGEFKGAIEGMMKLCDTMFDMKMHMLSLERNRFYAAMDRDATKALKKHLKLYNPRPANVRSSLQQLPQKTR
jgi:hypothetical protein